MIKREEGQALLESLLLGLVLLVPILWLLAVLSQLHVGALAVTAAVREAATDAARSADGRMASEAIERAVAQALVDHQLDPARSEVEWSGAGLRRGSSVYVEVSYPIPLLQAPLIGTVGGPSIWVRARHVTRVDPFRERATGG